MDALSILLAFFPTWRQIFLFALDLHPTTANLGSQFPKGTLTSLKFLSIVVFLLLYEVICIYPRTFCWCLSRFVSSALSLIPLFVFSNPCPPTNIIIGAMPMKIIFFLTWSLFTNKLEIDLPLSGINFILILL